MSTATTSPSVDITAAITDAVQVPAHTVSVGDYVFSTTGQTDRVVQVLTSRHHQRVAIASKNLWPIRLGYDETITILRGARR